jgi:hypothetical protein
VAGCAAHSTLAAGVGYTSIDLSVSYLRPITADLRVLRAEGSVVKQGQRVIFAEGRILGPAGELLATATSSLLVIAAGALNRRRKAPRPPCPLVRGCRAHNEADDGGGPVVVHLPYVAGRS